MVGNVSHATTTTASSDDYSNLNGTATPSVCQHLDTATVAGPETNTPTAIAACPAPNATKKCITIDQTTTTTTKTEASTSPPVLA